MPTPNRRNAAPTLHTAIAAFIAHRTSTGFKSNKDDVSTLSGPTGRVRGKKASGPALAQEFLNVSVDRLSRTDLTNWFARLYTQGKISRRASAA